MHIPERENAHESKLLTLRAGVSWTNQYRHLRSWSRWMFSLFVPIVKVGVEKSTFAIVTHWLLRNLMVRKLVSWTGLALVATFLCIMRHCCCFHVLSRGGLRPRNHLAYRYRMITSESQNSDISLARHESSNNSVIANRIERVLSGVQPTGDVILKGALAILSKGRLRNSTM